MALASRVCGVAVSVVIVGATLAATTILIVSALLTVVPTLSRTCTLKLLVPAVVGVPLITPVAAFRIRPAGKLPLMTLQV